MNLVVILGLLTVAAATQVTSDRQAMQMEGKKIEKRSHALWDPWAPVISSHYTYTAPVISKVRIVKPDWSALESSSSLSSGWNPDWYVGSPVTIKSSSGWSGGWTGGWNNAWKW